MTAMEEDWGQRSGPLPLLWQGERVQTGAAVTFFC